MFNPKNLSKDEIAQLNLTVKTGNKIVYTGNKLICNLPEGEYQYVIGCGGYKSKTDSLTVGKDNSTIDFSMERDICWDGKTYIEPGKDAKGVYLICNSEELMWFGKNAKMNDSAKLMSDITINQDMRLDESQLYQWTPIGKYVGYDGNKPYEGTFDGNGHSILGLYIPGIDANNAAFCGMLGETGAIKNLTIEGIVDNSRSESKYAAGFVGICKGTVSGCVNLAEVSGTKYVGGIVGSADKTSKIVNSVNRGNITASIFRAGGISGVTNADGSQAIFGCVNIGKVQAASFAGGITGDLYSGAGVINTYNMGDVVSQGPSGGIAGNFRSGTLKNVYTVGKVTGAQSSTGSIAGRLEWVGGSRTLDNVLWLEGICDSEIGNPQECNVSGQAQKLSEADLKSANLGDGYTEDRVPYINNGYPVLKWQVGEVTAPEKPESKPDAWNGSDSSEPQLVNGIYQIGSAAELKWFADQVNSGKTELKAVLTADIDLNNQDFAPIGGNAEDQAFRGDFDGNGKKITGFYQNATTSTYGLFTYNAGTIKNLTISGEAVARDIYGTVAGKNSRVIENCSNEVTISGGNQLGGIVGVNLKNGEIRRCSNKAEIEGMRMVGGIAGKNSTDGLIEECANNGTIISSKDFCGGVCAENEGNLLASYNKGLVVCQADILRSYTGGVVGHNGGYVADLYNTGCVVSAGGYVGGALGLSAVGSIGSSTADNMYGTGTVCGALFEDENAMEQHFVGGVTGNRTDAIKNAYYLADLKGAGGGIAKSSTEMKQKGFAATLGTSFKADSTNLNDGYPVLKWQDASNTLASKPALAGAVTISGETKAGEVLTANYEGVAKNLIYAWYTADEYGEYILSVSTKNTFKVPVDLVGYTVKVKVFSRDANGFAEASASKPIEGMNGRISISGIAVVGEVVKATYSRKADEPKFQWYRGSVKIAGANSDTYTVKDEDEGYVLKVRVTGNKAGFVEKAMNDKVLSAEAAGVWPKSETKEPAVVAGVYAISTEDELKWFASRVNGGQTGLDAKLVDNITISGEKWYPIGSEKKSFAGSFDGNGKTIAYALTSEGKAYQGLFGYVVGKGTVKNLTVNGTLNLGGESTTSGIIAGYAEGKLINCISKGAISAPNGTQIGGTVGSIGLHGKVEKCRNEATVSAKERAGGIAGVNSYADTYYCVNKGKVSVSGNEAGGIIGSAQNYAVITGCYNTAEVKGSMYVGGISGKIYVAAAPQACYNTGALTGTAYTAGVAGYLGGTDYIPIVTGSFYDKTLPADKTAKGLALSSMKGGRFAATLNSEAFEEIYAEDTKNQNDGLPILKWEIGAEEEKPEVPKPEVEKERITVSFTLVGDTKHGKNPHEDGNHVWIERTTLVGLPNGTTAYDVFKRVLGEKGYTFKAQGNSYIASITTPDGLTLGEFDNGVNSGWMYTINSVFPDYMESEKLKDGDDMRVFYTDDYTNTGWDPNGKPGSSTVNPDIINPNPTETPGTKDIDATVKDGNATVTIENSDIEKLIDDAVKGGASNIGINVRGAETANKIIFNISKTSISNILENTDAAFSINTQIGGLSMDKDAMKAAVQNATGERITLILEAKVATEEQKLQLGKDVVVTDISFVSENVSLTSLGNVKLTVNLPISSENAMSEADATKGTVAVALIGKDGKLIKLPGKLIILDEKQYYQFKTSELGTFVLATESKIDATIKAELKKPTDNKKIVVGVKKTKVVAKATAVKGAVKLSWKKSSRFKVDGYQVYRASKKNGKYTRILTTSKTACRYTKSLKKGKTYRFKIRGYRIIDGKKIYTKWSKPIGVKAK